MAPDTKVIAINLRLPPAVHKRLTKAANKGNRSLNSEILLRLQETFRTEDDRALDAELGLDYLRMRERELSSRMERLETIVTGWGNLQQAINDEATQRVANALEAPRSRGKDTAKGR